MSAEAPARNHALGAHIAFGAWLAWWQCDTHRERSASNRCHWFAMVRACAWAVQRCTAMHQGVSRRSVAGDVSWQSMHVWDPICVDSCTKGRRSYARRS